MSAEERWKRCQVARGLRCAVSNGAVEEEEGLRAPPFAVTFHLSEPMSIPILAQRALWALNYVQCCLAKGEQGALISKVPGLCCNLPHNIVSVESEADGTPVSNLALMRTQLRIFSVCADDGATTGHYMMLVVDSPAAFSLRKAILATSGSANRKAMVDVNYTDKRRAVWCDLAIHASQHVHAAGGIDDRVARYGSNLDWLSTTDGTGFTALFTVNAAVDWAKMHFLKEHRGAEEVQMTGFEDSLSNGRGDNFFTQEHIAACRQYHLAVEAGVDSTYQEQKTPKKRARDDEAREARDLHVPPPVLPEVRVPECEMALDVILPIPIEGPPPFEDFRTRVKNFPRSVSMRLLLAGMRLPENFLEGVDEERVDDATVKEIMLNAPLDTRSMLSGRDAALGEHMRALLEKVDAEERLERFEQGLALTLAIVRTRATGSDNYTHERVAAFNEHFIRSESESTAGCGRVHHEVSHVFAGGGGRLQERRLGNCDDEAQRFVARCLTSCNVELKLKPDNFYLLMQLICTDLMLGLDYHRSTLEAAPNGIGATLIVCDGGGNYRQEGGALVYSKTNGTGADHVMNAFMRLGEVPRYLRGCSFKCNYFEELKHATELSIVQTVCNSYIGTGEDATVERTITEAMKRTYATEFVANNSQGALNCMKALSWLVVRNTTTGGDSGVYKTTSETDEKKGRHTFVYRPAIGGLVLLCTNAVHANCYERFHTIAQVSRKVTSSAHVWGGAGPKDDEVNEATLLRVARPLFSDVMCTVANAGFAQWTGGLGNIGETATGRALVAVIHHQLDLSFNLFNPDMTGSDKSRFRQVSRARSVPIALLTLAVRETSEAGRQAKNHEVAVQRTCRALLTEGTQCAAWWLCAELLEHTLRWDFFCVMQMLAKAFRVPADLKLDEVLDWIETGTPGRLQALFEGSQFLAPSLFEPESGLLTPVAHCLYLRHPELDVGGLNTQPDATMEDHKGHFCRKLGGVLQGWSKRELSDGCRVKDTEVGRQIVGQMLLKCINEQFGWPSMFQGTDDTLMEFWKRRHPAPTNRSLAPLRMVHTGNGRATLGVDLRWLLVCAAMGGTVPSQTMRFMIVRHLARRMVQTCLPRRMLTAPRIFIGMPHASMERGMEPLDVAPSRLRRRLLLRHMRGMGTDAPVVPTGMVEDLGPAGPRLHLTRLLYGETGKTDCLPTESAHTPLPHDLWTPVQLEQRLGLGAGVAAAKGSYGGLKCNSDDGTFWLSLRHPETGAVLPAFNVTHGDYLYGRIAAAVRPLCVFDRPGVFVRVRGTAVVLVSTAYALGRMQEDVEPGPLADALDSLGGDASAGAIFYIGLCWQNDRARLVEATPEEVWDGVAPPDTPLWLDAEGLLADHSDLMFYSQEGARGAAQAGRLLRCKLDSQGAPEDLPEDCIFVRVRKVGGCAFDDGGGILSTDTREIDELTIGLAVHIRHVVLDAADRADYFHMVDR